MRYVVANWKQNKTESEALGWCDRFLAQTRQLDFNEVKVVICPPVVFLEKMAEVLKSTQVALGVQDVSSFADGAHTGSVGIDQIKPFCSFCIVGHSERNESRELSLTKAKVCLSAGITPIICFKRAEDYAVVDGAIYALEDPQYISVNGIYRPRSVSEVSDLVAGARNIFGGDSAVIYGGSVNGENAAGLASIKDLSGVLVGHASLNPSEFAAIVNKFFL